MAPLHLSRTRKRITGLPRAPDGSAFQKCEICGESIAIALYDMHDCKNQRKIKRFRGLVNKNQRHSRHTLECCKLESSQESEVSNHNIQLGNFHHQPRSPFSLFMESFRDDHKNEDQFDVDQRGFDTWKNMSTMERKKFVVEADRVNCAYEEALLREVDDSKVDDEADSEMIGKFDADYHYDHYYDSEGSGSSHIFWHY